MKQLYTANNKMFIIKGRYMQRLLQEIIHKGQETGEISKNMSPEEVNEYLFIAARGIAYDWCLHNGEYNLKDFMHKFIEKIVSLFKNQ